MLVCVSLIYLSISELVNELMCTVVAPNCVKDGLNNLQSRHRLVPNQVKCLSNVIVILNGTAIL